MAILPDPCYNYTVLDNPWRANNNTYPSARIYDSTVSWSGWYRLFINNMSAHIPDTCVEKYSCSTNITLWIRGGHPTVEDGVVTRDVCGNWENYCCFFGSFPINVKACPNSYYVYKLVRPTIYHAAYCAVINITLQEGCTSQSSGGCFQNLLEQIENITAQVLPLDTVKNILTLAFNASEKISESSSANPAELASNGNRVLKASEKLISTLVKQTDTSDSVSFTLPAVEGQVFMVGPNVTLDKIPRLDTTNTSVDIDLIGIAKNNERSAAVAFMSYNTMENLLKPDFFNTSKDTVNTMMSTVISATLPKTTNTELTKPVNFTLKHIRVVCAVISGLLHFLFLSGFVWMFIEAVLLFICVKNLSQLSSKKRAVLSSGFLCVIGYLVALVVVCVSVGLVPEGYGSEHCWIKRDKGFIWSFLGPVCVILALNIILFIKIIISLNSTLKTLNPEVSQMKQTKIMVFKTLAQFVVLGCSWILCFFTNGSKVLEILFLILNSQQGTFIFLIYCVFNNEVRQQYRKFFRCLCCGQKQH
ncbi:uncharacterized protein [Sinocyclocheilus grahami]|uniref:uncharacterized protein n=1 Tax=Sinocyclocheilus grahami TaxID=75366 RepID=UPI0007AD070B|nr:PREDICTED: uncharacterized protein LOC107594313 [Sinocyclocheilus grahami]